MVGAKKEKAALCAVAYHKKKENGRCQKESELLSAQVHIIKTWKMASAEKERVALCTDAYHKNKENGRWRKRERHSLHRLIK
jgi:hypothetical protein